MGVHWNYERKVPNEFIGQPIMLPQPCFVVLHPPLHFAVELVGIVHLFQNPTIPIEKAIELCHLFGRTED